MQAMFIAVIAGYVIAALFAFCGIFGIFFFLTGIQSGMDQLTFVRDLATSGWPLAAAAVIYLLTQIALMLERQGLLSAEWHEQKETEGETTAGKMVPPAPLPMGSYFHASAPPQQPPLPRMTPTMPQPPTGMPEGEPSIEEAADIATLAAKAAAQEASEPTDDIKPVIKRRDSDLSFFRVD